MKVIKEYEITKGSPIVAGQRFFSELKELNLPTSERDRFLRHFLDAYKRSEDYDLASQAVFRQIMPLLSREGAFKSFWQELNKQNKGDIVSWEGMKYKVEDVKPHFKNDENLYTICRMESPDGVSVVIKCKKILATEHELSTI